MDPRTARFLYCLIFALLTAAVVAFVSYSNVLRDSHIDFARLPVPAAQASQVSNSAVPQDSGEAKLTKIVKVGLEPSAKELLISSDSGLNCGSETAKSVKICLTTTIFKKVKLAYYDENNSLLLSSAEPVAIAPLPPAPDSSSDQEGAFLNVARGPQAQDALPSSYRGRLLISPDIEGQKINLINEIALEEYLWGVVPSEVPARFDPEALKAMACVARTYTLASLGRHQSEGFDLCSGVHCHVYGGRSVENPTVTEQVKLTQGLVVLSGNQLADTRYHAVCGGCGDAAEIAWPNTHPLPYLVYISDICDNFAWFDPALYPALQDKFASANIICDEVSESAFKSFIDNPPNAFCGKASRFRWQEQFTKENFSALIRESLPVLCSAASEQIGDIRELKVMARSQGGRCRELSVVTDKSSFRLIGDSIRWLTSGGKIGATGLKSTLFYASTDDNNIIIKGGGWGHGVGMCQEGAQGRALAGQSFVDIVAHYYPGTTLQRAEGEGGPAPATDISAPSVSDSAPSQQDLNGSESYNNGAESSAQPDNSLSGAPLVENGDSSI